MTMIVCIMQTKIAQMDMMLKDGERKKKKIPKPKPRVVRMGIGGNL